MSNIVIKFSRMSLILFLLLLFFPFVTILEHKNIVLAMFYSIAIKMMRIKGVIKGPKNFGVLSCKSSQYYHNQWREFERSEILEVNKFEPRDHPTR